VSSFDLFEFFRFLLTASATIYGLVRLIQFIWRWHGIDGTSAVGSAMLYHYFMVLLFRARFRRFLLDFIEIATLSLALLLLIDRHW
jgi:hypothetical protein